MFVRSEWRPTGETTRNGTVHRNKGDRRSRDRCDCPIATSPSDWDGMRLGVSALLMPSPSSFHGSKDLYILHTHLQKLI